MAKENIALDQLKKIEESKQKMLLVKMLGYLKEQARNVFKFKYITEKVLEELKVNATDKKAIIDWINSLPDVGLSEEDKKEVDKDIKKFMTEEKEEVEEEIKENPYKYSSGNNMYYTSL